MALDHGEKQDFNLEIVRDGFNECNPGDGQLYIDGYIKAFKELCRFFKLVGNIFAFVARDLGGKIDGLIHHRNSPNSSKYETFQSMIDHEVSTKLIEEWRPRPGSKCLLTLHRALEFILAFIRRIFEDNNEETSQIASEVYEETLSKHHMWIIQKMAGLAMMTLPSKRHLVALMCTHEYDDVLKLANEVLKAGQPVYDITQELYSQYGLLEIT